MNRFVHLRKQLQQGSMILEATFGILIFSLGILALVGLQASSTKQAEAGKYRTDAALLTNQLIGQMWVGGKSVANLQAQYESATDAPLYKTWYNTVQQTLPGASANPPTVTISDSGQVTISIFWLAPSEKSGTVPHKYVVVTQII